MESRHHQTREYQLLSRLRLDARPDLSAAVIVAHPDDETLGAGALLSRLTESWVICITDGAPRDERFVPEGAPGSPTKLAALRREQQRCALSLAGVGAERVMHLGVPDLEASDNLPGLVNRLTLLLRGLRPQLLITHAYEGGHPDHDAAAFALRAVVDRLTDEEGKAPLLVEMLGYHREKGELVGDRFLPAPTDRWAVTLRLTPRERRLRQEMAACFEGRGEDLKALADRGFERFRPAPHYDFSRAPHAGALHYETQGFPLDGKAWRRLAAAARRGLAA